jgi:hypothetical protein
VSYGHRNTFTEDGSSVPRLVGITCSNPVRGILIHGNMVSDCRRSDDTEVGGYDQGALVLISSVTASVVEDVTIRDNHLIGVSHVMRARGSQAWGRLVVQNNIMDGGTAVYVQESSGAPAVTIQDRNILDGAMEP